MYGSLGVALACTFTAAHIATPVLIYGADFTAKRALEREEEMEDEVELLRERLAILETKVFSVDRDIFFSDLSSRALLEL